MSLEPRGMQPLNKDRLPSMDVVGNHVHATPTFEHAWATPRHIVIGGS